ncbi:reductive dehalogenase [bacterium]|nr:reductive dehalogenase [bacterium]
MSDAIDRRGFLKLLGTSSFALGAGITAPTLVAKTEDGVLLESETEYGGFLIKKYTGDDYPYEIDPDVFKAMNEKFTVFSRNSWDMPARKDADSENISYRNLVEGEGKVPNQTRLDYALMAAAWATSSMSGGYQYEWQVQTGMIKGMGLDTMAPWDPAELGMTWNDAHLAVKHAALFFGASVAGVAALNPDWLYSNIYSPTEDDPEHTIPVIRNTDRFEKAEDAYYIPASMNRAIVMGIEEDYDGIANSPGRLASGAVGMGYSRMANTALFVAEFIRSLGYRALPAGNVVGLSIPMAIDAGLGELGRNGLLITPKFGPRVRLAKVITDMPLPTDSPITFGVREFCEQCKLCADECPSGSISHGPQTWEGESVSNNPGILKWYIKPEGCYDFNGFSCSNCKRVCPFNKPNNSWLHKVTRGIVGAGSGLTDKLMVNMDQISGYGHQLEDADFWKLTGEDTITGRDWK